MAALKSPLPWRERARDLDVPTGTRASGPPGQMIGASAGSDRTEEAVSILPLPQIPVPPMTFLPRTISGHICPHVFHAAPEMTREAESR